MNRGRVEWLEAGGTRVGMGMDGWSLSVSRDVLSCRVSHAKGRRQQACLAHDLGSFVVKW